MSAVQYRLVLGKKDERVDGSDDADVIVTVAAADASLDPSVAFMLGKLKSTGPTGPLFDELSSGETRRRLDALLAES
ncbi:MAG: hypothetical protein RLZZ39_917 [Actinomycetota bacterium]